MRRRAYIQSRDPNYCTVAYVKMFIENYLSFREFMEGGPPQVAAPLYPLKTKSLLHQRIGRAALVVSGKNPYEPFWCTRADIREACETLDDHERLALGRLYICGDTELEVAARLNTTTYTVSRIVFTAFEKIAAYLDGKPRC